MYAKLINSTQAEFSQAPQDGFKELHDTPRPSNYHSLQYQEYDDFISIEWVAPTDLESLRLTQRALIVQSSNQALAQWMAIYSEAEKLIAQNVDEESLSIMAEVRGVSMAQQSLDLETAYANAKLINAALSGFSLKLEDQIKQATTWQEILSIQWNTQELESIIYSAITPTTPS